MILEREFSVGFLDFRGGDGLTGFVFLTKPLQFVEVNTWRIFWRVEENLFKKIGLNWDWCSNISFGKDEWKDQRCNRL